jgi:hypothetical protein
MSPELEAAYRTVDAVQDSHDDAQRRVRELWEQVQTFERELRLKEGMIDGLRRHIAAQDEENNRLADQLIARGGFEQAVESATRFFDATHGEPLRALPLEF